MKAVSLDEMKEIQLSILKYVARLCEQNDIRYYLAYGTLIGAIRHGGFIPWDDDIDIILPRPDYDRLVGLLREQHDSIYRFVDYRDNWRIPFNFGKVIDSRTVWIPESRFGEQVSLGVGIDLFPLDGMPRRRLAKKWHFSIIWVLNKLLAVNAMDNARSRAPLKRLLIGLVQVGMNESIAIKCHDVIERLSRRFGFEEADEVCALVGQGTMKEVIPKTWLGRGVRITFEQHEFVAPEHFDEYLRAIYGDYMQLPPPEKRKSHHRFRAGWRSDDA